MRKKTLRGNSDVHFARRAIFVVLLAAMTLSGGLTSCAKGPNRVGENTKQHGEAESDGDGDPAGEPYGRFPQSSGVQNGLFSYNIPIEVPPGRGGMTPSLALSYTSQRSSGMLGRVGWGLSGLSQIMRCGKNQTRDLATDGVNFDATDNYCLDGVKLVELVESAWAAPSDLDIPSGLHVSGAYAPEDRSSVVRLLALSENVAGSDVLRSFVALHPGKVYRWYGASENSRLWATQYKKSALTNVTLGWLLSSEEHLRHEIRYSYVEDPTNCSLQHNENCDPTTSTGVHHAARYIDEITYTHWKGSSSPFATTTPRRVKFVWSTGLPDNDRDQWVNGVRLLYTQYLVRVEVYGQAGEHVRTYSLSSGATQSRRTGKNLLTSIRVCDKNLACLPDTTFEYSTDSAHGPSERVLFDTAREFQTPTPPTSIVVADLDTDEDDDVLVGNSLLLSNGTLSPTVFSTFEETPVGNPGAARVFDFELDMKNELLAIDTQSPNEFGQVSSMTIVPHQLDELATKFTPNKPTLEVNANALLPTIVYLDLDGDHQQEAVAFRELTPTDGYLFNIYWLKQHPSGEKKWEEKFKGLVPWDPARKLHYGGASVAEIDGDGRADLVYYKHNAAFGHYLSVDDSGQLVERPLGCDLRNSYFIDINGDGLSDALELSNDTEDWETIRLNTGHGFLPAQQFDLRLPKAVKFKFWIADLNEDQRQDLLVIRHWNGAFRTEVWLSDGATLHYSPTAFGVDLLPYENEGAGIEQAKYPQWQQTRSWPSVETMDVNNDGIPEIVAASAGENGPNQPTPADLKLRLLSQAHSEQHVSADLMIAVTDGLGYRQEVDYARLDQVDVACAVGEEESAPDPGDPCADQQVDPLELPLRRCTRSGIAVSAYRRHQPDGLPVRESTYRYEGAKTDLGGRGFIGFAAIVESDSLTHTETRTQYQLAPEKFGSNTAYPRAGLMCSQTTTRSSSANTPLYTHTTRWDWSVVPDSLLGTYFPQLDKETSTETLHQHGDATRTRSVSYVRDFQGYPKEIKTTHGNHTQLVELEYLYDYAEALLGLAEEVKVTDTLGLEAPVRHHTRNHYNPDGTLEYTIVEPESTDSDVYLKTDMTYGPGALLSRVESSDLGGSTKRGVDYTWTPDGYFVSKTTNDLGDETQTVMHANFGAPIQVTNPSGQSESVTYDSFGRLHRSVSSTGAAYTVSYGSSSSARPWFVTVANDDGAVSTTYYDNWQRPRRTVGQAFDGTPVQSTREYDQLGRLERETVPDYVGEPNPAATIYGYDDLDVATTITPAEGGPIHAGYEGFNVDVYTDALGRETRITHGSSGLVQSAEKSDSTGVLESSSFEYHADGKVRLVTRGGSFYRISYDVRRRPTESSLRDDWTKTYKWTAFGEMREFSHAGGGNSIVDTYVFDALGRRDSMTSVSDGQTSAQFWSYGTAGPARGKLTASWRDNDGDGQYEVGEFFGYDGLGRVGMHELVANGESSTIGYGYDGFGRLSTLTYPATNAPPLTLTYLYNQVGQLASIVDPKAAPLWERLYGGPKDTMVRKGSDLLTTQRFSTSGRLSEQETTSSAGTLYKKTYSYYDDGRVKSVADDVTDTFESFQYDGLGRIREWNRAFSTGPISTAPTGRRYSYDPAHHGALSSVEYLDTIGQPKRQVTYTFDADYPSSVSSMTSQDLSPGAPQEVKSFGYDGLGRELTKSTPTGVRGVTHYNRFNLPDQVISAGEPIDFLYTGGGQRVLERTTTRTTLRHGQLYERTTDPSGTKHSLYLYADQRIGELVYEPGSQEYKAHFFEEGHTGSLDVVADASGAEVSRHYTTPFGIPLSHAGFELTNADGARYAGHTRDAEAGLVHMKARLYDVDSRRFTSPDPIWNGFDVHGYVRNDPVNLVDPTGMQDQPDCTWGWCPPPIQPPPPEGPGGGNSSSDDPAPKKSPKHPHHDSAPPEPPKPAQVVAGAGDGSGAAVSGPDLEALPESDHEAPSFTPWQLSNTWGHRAPLGFGVGFGPQPSQYSGPAKPAADKPTSRPPASIPVEDVGFSAGAGIGIVGGRYTYKPVDREPFYLTYFGVGLMSPGAEVHSHVGVTVGSDLSPDGLAGPSLGFSATSTGASGSVSVGSTVTFLGGVAISSPGTSVSFTIAWPEGKISPNGCNTRGCAFAGKPVPLSDMLPKGKGCRTRGCAFAGRIGPKPLVVDKGVAEAAAALAESLK
ncbi:MAG: RHS repeat-associated core domain-containing protein [Polyangiaceae bacterium]